MNDYCRAPDCTEYSTSTSYFCTKHTTVESPKCEVCKRVKTNGGTCKGCLDDVEPRPSRPEDVANHAVKFDSGKPRLELIPASAIEAMGLVLGYGAKKYADYNFLKGMAHTRLAGAALRHIFSYLRGEDIDPESGLTHLSHALASLAMLIETQARGKGSDDRYKEVK